MKAVTNSDSIIMPADTAESRIPLTDRGPEGRLHITTYTDGCYYGRPESCCGLCWLRLATFPARRKISDAIN